MQIPPPAEPGSTSGCEDSDFADFEPGNIALVQRGTCTFADKAVNAEEAGASAVIIFNEGQEGRLPGRHLRRRRLIVRSLAGRKGSAQIEAEFESHFTNKGLPFQGTEFSGRSDYQAFIDNGIPSGGLFTGAEGIKTEEEGPSTTASPVSSTTRATTKPATASPDPRWC